MKTTQLSFNFEPEKIETEKRKSLIQAAIGEKYQYNKGGQVFEVAKINYCTVVFACGHWCTDNVFNDLYTC